MQFGCDPKSDSTNTLRNGEYIPSVLDLMRENRKVDAHAAIFRGFGGTYCVEAGGPQPGVGCAGRGIITAVQLLKQQEIFEELDLDYVIFDVLGDVVCGGFAVPIRDGIADHVFTVSSADFMSIYASNNLFRGIQKYSNAGGALLGGLIANSINTPFQREIIDDFVAKTKTQILEYVPRSLTVTQAELQGKTTIEAAPNSEQAGIYRRLAKRLAEHTVSAVPSPLSSSELRAWSAGWATHLIENERALHARESDFVGVSDGH
jgi:nitrogenase iron protein NifH